MPANVCRVLLVQPKFLDNSFWNYTASCRLVGAKFPSPPLNLITIAAMMPDTWDCRLVDENIETLKDKALAWADLVMIGAMIPQRPAASTRRSNSRPMSRARRCRAMICSGAGLI